MRRRTSTRLLAMMLVLMAGAPRAARAAEVQGHVEGGAIVGVGLPAGTNSVTLGADATRWWAPASRIQLGLQTGVGLTLLPYGDFDAQPVIGEPGHNGAGDRVTEGVTLLPRALFGARLPLGQSASLGAFAGATFLVARELREWSFVPYPTAAVAFETRFGPASRLGLRAAFSYIHFIYGASSRSFLAPSLAFSWS